jgi:aquaporin Z
MKRISAEFLGTFRLVFGGCGAAVLAAAFPQLGIGFGGVALAFGVTVMTMCFAVGHISGGHFNPAVTVGLAMAKRFPWNNVLAYIAVQVLRAIVAGGVLFAIAGGKPGFSPGGFAADGFGGHSPGGYSLESAILAEPRA